eukprot:13858578-Alexandrium_andersonii.AAC.1
MSEVDGVELLASQAGAARLFLHEAGREVVADLRQVLASKEPTHGLLEFLEDAGTAVPCRNAVPHSRTPRVVKMASPP